MAEAIEQLLNAIAWKPVPRLPTAGDGLPYVTHEGTLTFGETALRCYQLSTGQRVVDGEDLAEFFGLSN